MPKNLGSERPNVLDSKYEIFDDFGNTRAVTDPIDF
jgi:hypothetical protein